MGVTSAVLRAGPGRTLLADTPYSKAWVAAIKKLIPRDRRQWTGAIWVFDMSYYELVKAATFHFHFHVVDKVESTDIPQVSWWQDTWNLYKNTRQEESDVRRVPAGAYYATLHLLESAPPEVVRASYRALCLLNHPDVGGSVDLMTEINNAMDQLVDMGLV